MCSVLAEVRGTPQCWYTARTSTYHLLHTASCLPSPVPGPQRTREFDLYMIFHPLLSKDKAIGVGNQLYRWIKVTQTHTHTHACVRLLYMYTRICTCACVFTCTVTFTCVHYLSLQAVCTYVHFVQCTKCTSWTQAISACSPSPFPQHEEEKLFLSSFPTY